MKLKTSYSAREVAALSGLTARQLQWWDASRVFPPAIAPRRTTSGGFTERRYTPVDVVELVVLADLRRRGFTVFELRTITRVLDQYFGASLFEATGGGGRVQLLTDGDAIYARTATGAFYNLLDSPQQPLMVVGNEGLLKELSGKVRGTRKKRKR